MKTVQKPYSEEKVSKQAYIDMVEIEQDELVDYAIPLISVWFKNTQISKVLTDGGSGVNISTMSICRQLEIQPTPCYIHMVDQSRVPSIGLIKASIIKIQNIPFKVTFVVIELIGKSNKYNLLIGRPWLKHAKVQHDWGSQAITFQRGHKKYSIPLKDMQHYLKAQIPSIIEPPHMIDGLKEDEELKFLEANRDLWSVGLVDISEALAKFEQDPIVTTMETEEMSLPMEDKIAWLAKDDFLNQTNVHIQEDQVE
ncbi:hypothetical protein KP509_31G025300 [Ceratopteris richardii]|uniref:Uncharacterized protein n=1 Tax=Ceratopteris richardii TaxID=49495 RepID=A0A8T2QX20_CERRI|nr:hypothetical protein KP509_31G025300 [Ceratopteris richardii]